MKKKIFFLGDFESNNGPGIANGYIKEAFENNEDFVFSAQKNVVRRVKEIFVQIKRCDILVICNYTRLHVLAAVLARKKGKRCVYRQHGYAAYEIPLNEKNVSKIKLMQIKKAEDTILKNSDQIICVSKLSMEFMKKMNPAYANKYAFVYNGIDLTELKEIQAGPEEKRKQNQIFSTGGGIRQKNNRKICEAIEILNDRGHSLKYIVVGQAGMDKEEIDSYDFLEYHENLPRKDVFRIMKDSNIYVQNSYMETFGIAVVEAVACGCNVLLAKNIGALEIMSTIQEDDVIQDNMDSWEIAKKIEKLLQNGNNQRIQNGLQMDKIDKIQTMGCLLEKIVGA